MTTKRLAPSDATTERQAANIHKSTNINIGAVTNRLQSLQRFVDQSPRLTTQNQIISGLFGPPMQHNQKTAIGQEVRKESPKGFAKDSHDSGSSVSSTTNSRTQPLASRAMPVQRIKIHSVEYTKRVGNDPDCLEEGGEFCGNSRAEEEIIDEYLERNPKADFEHSGVWETEIKLRAELIEGMRLINSQGLFHYNWKTDDLSMPDEWTPVYTKQGGSRQDAAFTPKGKQLSAAIRTLFRLPNHGERYYLECSSAILAVHYRALMEVMEAKQNGSFDKYKQPIVITTADVKEVKLGNANQTPPGWDLYTQVKLKSLDDLLPGDWVYFKSFKDYDNTHAGPQAAWSGEHALYLGNGRYQGFGTLVLNYTGMVEAIIRNYNRMGLKDKSMKKSMEARDDYPDALGGQLPGIVDVYRMNNHARPKESKQ